MAKREMDERINITTKLFDEGYVTPLERAAHDDLEEILSRTARGNEQKGCGGRKTTAELFVKLAEFLAKQPPDSLVTD